MSEGQQASDGRQEREHLLQASSRLDWRFLLPDGGLVDVGFVGNPGSSLLRSLQIFSKTVTIVGPDICAGDDRTFDVLVLQAARRQALKRARPRVRSGGCLYAEIHRLGGGSLRTALVHPSSWAATARHGGFIDVELHWHWPTFENCTRIVPLERGAAFAYLLSKGRSDAVARAKAAAGRQLLERGILGWGIGCFSLVARSP